MRLEYRLLVYKIKGKHRLVRRFRSYWKMSEWLVNHVREEEFNLYKIKKQKV